jgi:hypothetical protein
MSAPRQSRRSNRNSLSDIDVQRQIGGRSVGRMALAALWLADAGAILVVAAVGIWVGLLPRPRWLRSRARRAPAQVWTPPPRPLEECVAQARRLGQLHHLPVEGRSRAKSEGIRQAYDDALADCCRRLDIVHLLEVVAPGPELDEERLRVERRLAHSGVDLHLTG